MILACVSESAYSETKRRECSARHRVIPAIRPALRKNMLLTASQHRLLKTKREYEMRVARILHANGTESLAPEPLIATLTMRMLGSPALRTVGPRHPKLEPIRQPHSRWRN